MKKILILTIGLLLISINLYAAGDLIVEGNIGIGTNTPNVVLTVRDAGNEAFSFGYPNAGTGVIGEHRIRYDSAGVIISADHTNLTPSSYLTLLVGGTHYLRINDNGDINISGNLILSTGSDIRPSANSTTAINIAQADGTDFVTFDTTNKKIGFFNSYGAIPASTLGADMYLTTSDVSASSQMFRAAFAQQGVNTTYNRIFQTGNYAMRIDGASTAGLFYGMTGAGQVNNNSCDVQRLFGVKATAYGQSSYTGHVDLGGGLIAEVGVADADWDEAAGIYVNAFTKGTGLADFAYGIHLKKQTIGTTNAGIVLDGDGSGADIVFGPNREARIYSTSGRLYAQDQLGNQTIISPHDPETGEWVFYSKNVKTGKVVRVDMEKLVKAVERLTGEKFMVETMGEVKE